MIRRERNTKFFDNAKKSNVPASIQSVLRSARATGQANISNRKLSVFPVEICHYDESYEEGEKYWEIFELTKLDVSYNAVTSLPPDIERLSSLQILKARDNKIDEICPQLFLCSRLTHLDFAFNSISHLDPNIGNLIELKELFLNDNRLSDLPANVKLCTNLMVLELQSNSLKELPDIRNLVGLTKLNISCNKFRTLPDSLSLLTNLVSLECKKNALESFPDIRYLGKLSLLDVSENSLNSIPFLPRETKFGKPVLDRLYLSFNRIPQITFDNLASVSDSLTEIIIHDCSISIIPTELAMMWKLKVLDISNNNISDLPASLGYNAALQRLVIEGNPIRSIRRSLLSQSTHDLKAYLRTRGPPLQLGNRIYDDFASSDCVSSASSSAGEIRGMNGQVIGNIDGIFIDRVRNVSAGKLDFSNLKLEQWNESMLEWIKTTHLWSDENGSIASITSLDLSRNHWKQFPLDFLALFGCLKELNLSKSMLSSLCNPSIQSSSQLMWNHQNLAGNGLISLDLRDNQLESCHLQDVFAFNPSIELLYLSNNWLEVLPASLQYCKALREMQLDNNRLKSVDAIDFGGFSKLQILNLSNNQLSSILPLIHLSRRSIHSLSLENNNIKEIPPELGILPLKYLGLYGNPLKSIRPSLLSNTTAILQALKNRLREEVVVILDRDSNNGVDTSSLEGIQNSFDSSRNSNHMSTINSRDTRITDSHSHSRSNGNSNCNLSGSTSCKYEKQRSSNDSNVFQMSNALAINPSTQVQVSMSSGSTMGDRNQQLDKLRQEIRQLEQERDNNLSLTTAKRTQLMKSLALKRATLIRESKF